MPGLIHDWVAAQLPQFVIHDLRALHLADKGGPRLARKNLATEDEHEHVTVDNLAVLVDGANPIAITIQRDPKIRLVLANAFTQIYKVRENGRIGMMTRE